MTLNINHVNSYPITVFISPPFFLAKEVIKKLINLETVIYIFSEDSLLWAKESSVFSNNENLKIFPLEKFREIVNSEFLENIDYLYFFGGFQEREKDNRLIQMFSKSLFKKGVKSLAILPATLSGAEEIYSHLEIYFQKIVYLGKIFGKDVVFNKEDFFEQTLKYKYSYFLSLEDAPENMVRLMLSYSAQKKNLFLADKIASDEVLDIAAKTDIFVPGKIENSSREDYAVGKELLKVKSSRTIQEKLEDYFEESAKETKIEVKAFNKKNISFEKKRTGFFALIKNISFEKWTRKPLLKTYRFRGFRFSLNILFWSILLMVFLVPFIFPFIFIAGSLATLSLAYEKSTRGDLVTTKKLLFISDRLGGIAQKVSSQILEIPLVGRGSSLSLSSSSFLKKLSGSGLRVVKISEHLLVLGTGLFGDGEYDIYKTSRDLNLELDALYKELSFIQSEIDQLPESSKKLLPDTNKISKIRTEIARYKDLALAFPEIFGGDKKKTYLVLFQNNMELRPTGGFIGSFGLPVFDKGKLVEMPIYDVYSADGQLKGHVEPPPPIKEYLGEANWYLRDSNWDPDFSTSALRASWFLEKEMDKKVDGVIAVDLDVAKSLLRVTGPININGQKVDAKNLYEKTQYEVEENFFPGSRKKANFLSSLGRELINKVTNLKVQNYPVLLQDLIKNLEERHIQVSLNSDKLSKVFEDLGWDGSAFMAQCPGECALNWFGVIEANVGVNKANYFVGRNFSLFSIVSKNDIENTLDINLFNNGETGPKFRYKVYLRIIAPLNSEFEDVELIDSNGSKRLKPEIFISGPKKEAGIIVDIPGGGYSVATFRWKLPFKQSFEKTGEYMLYWRKQAGVNANISVRSVFPAGLKTVSLPPLGLTNDGVYIYNSNLSTDFVSKIYW